MILVQIQTLLIMLALSFLYIFTCTFSKSEDFNPSQNLLCFILKVLSCCCHLTFHHLYLICSWAILFICSPHTAGLIIEDACLGFCVLLYSEGCLAHSFKFFLEQLSFIIQDAIFIQTFIILKIFWIPARIWNAWKSHLKNMKACGFLHT